MLDLLLLVALAAALFVLVEETHKSLDRRRDRSLSPVYRRETAMEVLSRFTSPTHTVSQWNRCVTCGGRVLVENTWYGVCEDCLLDTGVHLPVVDEEWAALQKAIDDENAEGDDHR